MAQLVGPRIQLVNTMSNTRLDREASRLKFDVFPEQIVDYLALVGDSSDNIPGVTGVGPKTAAKWLNQYQNLDSLIVNAASSPAGSARTCAVNCRCSNYRASSPRSIPPYR